MLNQELKRCFVVNVPHFTNFKPKIRLYEMFMRDGLQSLKQVYPLETKLKFLNQLAKCNFDYVELGSTTNPKILPQMSNSYKLFEHVLPNGKTKYGMLVPSYSHVSKVLEHNINSFGLVCSMSETFAQKNLNKTSEQTIEQVDKQLDYIILNKPNAHVRIYLSCSFGSPWEKFDVEHFNKLSNVIHYFVTKAKQLNLSAENFDLVISDTVGLSNDSRTKFILNCVEYSIEQSNFDYLAMHIHSKSDQWKSLIESCINSHIYKFDCSIGGVGGCPFAEDHALGNICSLSLVKYLQSFGLAKNYNLDVLEQTDSDIKMLM